MNLKLAWRNTWRNKRRSLIAIASISFAVFFACLMLSMQLGSYDRMIDNAVRFHTGYVQVHRHGFWDDKTIDNSMILDSGLFNTISQVGHVTVAAPRIESFALASNEEKTKGAMVIGMEPEPEDQLTRVKGKVVEGEYLHSDDNQALVAQGLAKYLQLEVGDTIVMISRGFHGVNAAAKYHVKGIVKIPMPDLNNQLIYLPLKEAQWFFDAADRATALALIIDDPDNTGKTVKRLQDQLSGDFEVMGWRELMPELVQGIEFDYVSGLIMMYILYAVIGFGIFGVFLMMTNERTYEFGILLSVGMKRTRLQQVVLLEVILIGLIGVVGGIILSLPIITYFHNHPIYLGGEYEKMFEQFGMEPVMPFSMDGVIFYRQAVIVLIMSLLIGLYPLFKIFQMDPARAIRQ